MQAPNTKTMAGKKPRKNSGKCGVAGHEMAQLRRAAGLNVKPRSANRARGAHLPIDGGSGGWPEAAQASQPAWPSIGRRAPGRGAAVIAFRNLQQRVIAFEVQSPLRSFSISRNCSKAASRSSTMPEVMTVERMKRTEFKRLASVCPSPDRFEDLFGQNRKAESWNTRSSI